MADIEGPEQLPFVGQAAQDGEIGLLRPPHMTLTVPMEDVRHTVTDDQLDVLCRGGKDGSRDIFLLLAGAGVGLVQNLLAVGNSMIKGSSYSASDIILALLCVACFSGAAAKYTEQRQRGGDIDKLRQRIVDGKKVNVR